jgi:hypothetical protein
MGKITTIYLTDNESIRLKKFCDENQCTQYSALKTAVKELISKANQSTSEIDNTQSNEELIEVKQEHKSKRKLLAVLP